MTELAYPIVTTARLPQETEAQRENRVARNNIQPELRPLEDTIAEVHQQHENREHVPSDDYPTPQDIIADEVYARSLLRPNRPIAEDAWDGGSTIY